MRPRTATWTRRGWRPGTIGVIAVLAALTAAPGHAAGSVHFGDNLVGTGQTRASSAAGTARCGTPTSTSPIQPGRSLHQSTAYWSPGPSRRRQRAAGRRSSGAPAGDGAWWARSGGDWAPRRTSIPSTAGGIQSYPTRLPIAQGNYIGIEFDNDFGRASHVRQQHLRRLDEAALSPIPDRRAPRDDLRNFSGWQIFLRGTVEPDADGDGFGDETQDKCPGTSGATAGCVPKKKCKRKKRKGKKAAAKKKRCKRKGKKRK